MRKSLLRVVGGAVMAAAMAAVVSADEGKVQAPVSQRYAAEDSTESPDFQRHVAPLLGRLGCNSRSCHGSFQGRGGFRLSLFGYDFKFDHDALLAGDPARVNTQDPEASPIIVKPTDENEHEGGKRYDKGTWQHHLIRSWVKNGAKYDQADDQTLVTLEVTPAEIVVNKSGQKIALKAVAVWPDGTREDVTPLCRFQSNDEQIAKIDENGLITTGSVGDTHLVVFYDNAVVPVPIMRPVSDLIGKKYPATPTHNKVDELVLDKLRKLGIVQSDLSSDAEFLRRVSLDMTGTLPTATEVEAFLKNPSPNKRAEKIDELLESPAYAAWWTTRLCDFTGNNDAQIRNVLPQARGRQGTASQDWYDWIHKRVADNTPYDQLVAGMVASVSRAPGQSYADYSKEMCDIYRGDGDKNYADRHEMPYFWARQDLRIPEARTIAFAYSFLGIRIQCAQCHKHPFDQWSKQDFEQFTNFFRYVSFDGRSRDKEKQKEVDALIAELKLDPKLRGNQARQEYGKLMMEGKTIPFPELEVSKQPITQRGDMAEPLTTPISTARLLGGETLKVSDYEDIRKPLMDWMRSANNPYFARAFVNRVWADYFNVGIVSPPDDMSLANPPSNKPLLDYLSQGFIENGFDMKWVHRTIANSRTYQLSWRPNDTNKLDERNFSHSVPRRLPAEVVYDAVQSATASDEKAGAMRSEMKGRTIAMAGASNRNANTGSSFALSVFGKSTRESNCDCDRSNEASLLQTVFLQNDREMLATLDRGDGWIAQVAKANKPAKSAPVETGRADKARTALEQQIAQMEKRLERLRKQGSEKEVQAGEKRVAEAKARLAELTPKAEDKPEPSAAGGEDKLAANGLDEAKVAELVNQAYLRSLSRYPSDQERERSVTHIRASDSPYDGLKDLLWALVNTKEFILNH